MRLFSDNSRPGHINGQGTCTCCDENDFMNNPALPKLSDVQRTQCEGPVIAKTTGPMVSG